MKGSIRKRAIQALLALFVMLAGLSPVSAEEYEGMKGVDSVHVFFDMRDAIPMIADVHLSLILDTYNDLVAMNKNPDFAVVFMGGSVKLISSDRGHFSAEERKHLDAIAETLTKMSKAGIHLEVCLAAVKYFKVDPTTIQPALKHVANGWISEIGYQAKGYQLVPVY